MEHLNIYGSVYTTGEKNEAAAAVIINHAAFLEDTLAKRYFPSWHCQVDHHGVVFLECEALQLFIYSLDPMTVIDLDWNDEGGKSKITK